MRYELILISLAAFDVCFMIRDIVDKFMPDFACCDDEFLWLSAVRLYIYGVLRCLDYDFSHWLYGVAYFDG